MRRHFISLLTLLAAMTTNAGAQNLDKWKAYMAYGKITDIEPAGNMVYVLSSGDLFSYNITDGSVATYDKVFPLSECTISQIAWNNTAKKLIIVYDNYNIDLLDNKLNEHRGLLRQDDDGKQGCKQGGDRGQSGISVYGFRTGAN